MGGGIWTGHRGLGSAKLNNVNPEKYLTHVLKVIADHPINQIEDLLPWRVTL